MSDGWIKIHRNITEWEWWDDPLMVKLFLYLLLHANHKERQWQGQIIRRGEMITTLQHLRDKTGLTVQQIRTRLKRLKSTKELTYKSTNRFTVISIINYDSYQAAYPEDNTQFNKRSNKQITNKQQTDNKQITTNKNVKNVKNVKNIKFNPAGKKKYLDNVYLDDKQLERVKKYYQRKGLEPEDLQEAIRELDRWFTENPKMRLKRVDDAKALMGWPLDNALKRRRELISLQKLEGRQNHGGKYST